MRVIVLGGTRFIGRAIVEELAGSGNEVLVVHRGQLEPDDMPPVRHLHAERTELGEHKAELESFEPDAAIDCRALTRADSETAIGAVPDGIRLIVISSVDVYRAFGALNDDRESDPVPLDEESPVRPNRYPYRGRMPGMEQYDKLDVEDVYLAKGATSFRLPMVYGEHDYQLREEFILRRVRSGRTRIPFGSGQWLTCRGYVRDIARGVHLALQTPAAAGQVMNLCEDRTYSMRMWSRMILDAAGSSAELVQVPEDLLPEDLKPTGTMTQHILASARKARTMLGWTTSDPHESLRTTVSWHLANPPDDAGADFAPDDLALAHVGG
ncbi:MAG: NAD-dependent epimerase/dehydratase family protein [Candidatus Dormiibacterota bacterium]